MLVKDIGRGAPYAYGVSKNMDGGFFDRLILAARHAKIGTGQAALAAHIGEGLTRQTVDQWKAGSTPKVEMVFKIADRFGVDPRWLGTGEGSMLIRPVSSDLTAQEEDLLARYRDSDPRWQLSLRLLAALATEDQIEAATDVNVVIARILGKKPAELRYPSDARVRRALGDAPHVAARKRAKEK